MQISFVIITIFSILSDATPIHPLAKLRAQKDAGPPREPGDALDNTNNIPQPLDPLSSQHPTGIIGSFSGSNRDTPSLALQDKKFDLEQLSSRVPLAESLRPPYTPTDLSGDASPSNVDASSQGLAPPQERKYHRRKGKTACDICRDRQLECLQLENFTAGDQCRRCQRYGHPCVLTPVDMLPKEEERQKKREKAFQDALEKRRSGIKLSKTERLALGAGQARLHYKKHQTVLRAAAKEYYYLKKRGKNGLLTDNVMKGEKPDPKNGINIADDSKS